MSPWPKGSLAHIIDSAIAYHWLTESLNAYPPASAADEIISERDATEKDLIESIRKFDHENVTVPW